MTATTLPFPQAPPLAWPRHTGGKAVGRVRSKEGVGAQGRYLTRRDFLKLAGFAALAGLITACGPAPTEVESVTTQTPEEALDFSKPKETGNFYTPLRPWATVDGQTGKVTKENISYIMSRLSWTHANNPVYSMTSGQGVVRALETWAGGNMVATIDNTGALKDYGYEKRETKSDFWYGARGDEELHFDMRTPDQLMRVLASRRVGVDRSVIDSLEGDQKKFVESAGDQHSLIDQQTGVKMKIPGNVTQITGLTNMLNVLYERIVNENVHGLMAGVDKTEAFLQQRDMMLDSLYQVKVDPETGVNSLDTPEQVLSTFMAAAGYSEGMEGSLYQELLTNVLLLRNVDTTNIPSAELAESIMLSIANADSVLVKTNMMDPAVNMAERKAFLPQYDPDSAVPFTSENNVKKLVSENWMRIPVARPRVFEVRVEKFKINDKNEKVSDGFDRRIIFSSYTGDSQIYSDSKGNIGDFEPKLGNTASISMDDLKNQQMLYEGNLFALNASEELRQLNEVSQDKVRLYSVPNTNILSWGVETPKTGIVPNGLWDTFVSKLGIGYDKIQFQDILLDTGKEFISSPDGYFQQGWLTDMTEKWIRAQKEGVKELHSLGLFTPTEYLHRLARGPLFVPSDSNLKDLFLQYYIMSDFTGGTNNMKSNNFACTMTDRPVYSSFGNVLSDAGTLKAGDFFAYDKNLTVVNGTPYMKIFSLAGGELLTPLDFNTIQLIDNGTKDRMIETAKDWVPLALAVFGLGPKVYNGAMRILEFFF